MQSTFTGRFAALGGLLLLLALGLPLAGAQESSHSIYLNTGRLDTVAPVALRQIAATTGAAQQLIQFTGPIQPEWYTALLQTGVRILHLSLIHI